MTRPSSIQSKMDIDDYQYLRMRSSSLLLCSYERRRIWFLPIGCSSILDQSDCCIPILEGIFAKILCFWVSIFVVQKKWEKKEKFLFLYTNMNETIREVLCFFRISFLSLSLSKFLSFRPGRRIEF